MNLEIRENPIFLRYYEIWQRNPSSVVFAPLAEMLLLHECYEEAITVCKKGLEKNPDLVSGRIALAKGYLAVGNLKRAEEEAGKVLEEYPEHPEALNIINNRPKKPVSMNIKEDRSINDLSPSSLDPSKDIRWNTLTMAEIFAGQGNIVMARKIYEKILTTDPTNKKAMDGLNKISADSMVME